MLLQSKVTPCNCCCLIANSKSSRYRTRSAASNCPLQIYLPTCLLFSGTIAGAQGSHRIFRIRHILSRARVLIALVHHPRHTQRDYYNKYNDRTECAAVSIYFFAIPLLRFSSPIPRQRRPASTLGLQTSRVRDSFQRIPNGYPPPFEFVFDPDVRATFPLPLTGQFRRESRATGTHCRRQTMPDDKNVKLMLFCSHCLRRCATFATRLDEPLLLAWNYILHLRLLYHIPYSLSLFLSTFSTDRTATDFLSFPTCSICSLLLVVTSPPTERVTSSVSQYCIAPLAFVHSFVRFPPLNRYRSPPPPLVALYCLNVVPEIIKTIDEKR